MVAKISAFFFVLAIIHGSLAQNSCRTPQGGNGVCIVLTSCPSLYALVRNRPIPDAAADLLRRSNCGFTDSLPNVCCPRGAGGSGGAGGQVSQNEQIRDNPQLPGLDVCGQNTQERIVGGTATDLDEFPWMAMLEYTRPNGRGFYCGGVLISERYVLTAAHCVRGSDIPRTYRLVSVRLGEHNTVTNPDCAPSGECAPTPIDVPIESTDVHSGYRPNDVSQPNDIALLRLARPVTFSNYIQPICLPLQNRALLRQDFLGYDLYVAGWGRTENRSDSEVKLKVRVPVVARSTCRTRYQSLGATIGQTHLCAGGRTGQDSCRGDSGGPLMGLEITGQRDNWFVFGLVSYGPTPCGTANWPGVYTKVGDYSAWISNRVLA